MVQKPNYRIAALLIILVVLLLIAHSILKPMGIHILDFLDL